MAAETAERLGRPGPLVKRSYSRAAPGRCGLADHEHVPVPINGVPRAGREQQLGHLPLRPRRWIEDEQAVAPDCLLGSDDARAEVDDSLDLLRRQELEAPV